jgi:hypothetical protein
MFSTFSSFDVYVLSCGGTAAIISTSKNIEKNFLKNHRMDGSGGGGVDSGRTFPCSIWWSPNIDVEEGGVVRLHGPMGREEQFIGHLR